MRYLPLSQLKVSRIELGTRYTIQFPFVYLHSEEGEITYSTISVRGHLTSSLIMMIICVGSYNKADSQVPSCLRIHRDSCGSGQ